MKLKIISQHGLLISPPVQCCINQINCVIFILTTFRIEVQPKCVTQFRIQWQPTSTNDFVTFFVHIKHVEIMSIFSVSKYVYVVIYRSVYCWFNQK